LAPRTTFTRGPMDREYVRFEFAHKPARTSDDPPPVAEKMVPSAPLLKLPRWTTSGEIRCLFYSAAKKEDEDVFLIDGRSLFAVSLA